MVIMLPSYDSENPDRLVAGMDKAFVLGVGERIEQWHGRV